MRNQPLDLTSWLTKIQAAQELGVGTKTVDRMADKNQIRRDLRSRPGLATVAIFHPGDIQREKQRRMAPVCVVPSRVELPVDQESNMSTKAALGKDLGDMQSKLLGADVTLTLQMPAHVLDWFKKQGKNREGDMTAGQAILEYLFSEYLEGCGEELQAKTHLLDTYAVRFGRRPPEERGEESNTAR
jgi:hypothetical protein